MLDILKRISENVNSRIETDPKVREAIVEKDRTVVLNFTDIDRSYVLSVKDGRMEEPIEGTIDDPTLRVTTDTDTMKKLIDRKMNPLMAYAMRKIRVEGPVEEIMMLKDLF